MREVALTSRADVIYILRKRGTAVDSIGKTEHDAARDRG